MRVLRLAKQDYERVYKYLSECSFQEVTDPNAKHVWALKNDKVEAVLCKSGILALRGPNNEIETLAQQILDFIPPIDTVEIGCDESGTEMRCGPLVVCCAVITPQVYKKVLALGVKDSKLYKNKNTVINKARKLRKIVDYRCELLEKPELNITFVLNNLKKL